MEICSIKPVQELAYSNAESNNALSDHGIEMLVSKSTQNRNEKYAAYCQLQTHSIQARLRSWGQCFNEKLLEQSYTQDTRESKLKLSDATF